MSNKEVKLKPIEAIIYVIGVLFMKLLIIYPIQSFIIWALITLTFSLSISFIQVYVILLIYKIFISNPSVYIKNPTEYQNKFLNTFR
jgi:hypothetical protein